jgi:hypothetical protein
MAGFIEEFLHQCLHGDVEPFHLGLAFIPFLYFLKSPLLPLLGQYNSTAIVNL